MASSDAAMPDAPAESPGFTLHTPSYPDPNAPEPEEVAAADESPASLPIEDPEVDYDEDSGAGSFVDDPAACAQYEKLKRKAHDRTNLAADLAEAHHTLSLVAAKAQARSDKAYKKRRTENPGAAMSVAEHMLESRATEAYENAEYVRCLQIDMQTEAAEAKYAQRKFARARAARTVSVDATTLQEAVKDCISV